MNKQKFISVLQDFDNIEDHERNGLHELAKQYPYSQIIHTLVAKANNDARTNIAGQTLNYAAMYATDRNVLKTVIQHNPARASVSAKQATQKNHLATRGGEKSTFTLNNSPKFIDSERLRKEVFLDLAALEKSKASYQQWEANNDSEVLTENKAAVKKKKKNKAVEEIAVGGIKKEKGRKKAVKAKSKNTSLDSGQKKKKPSKTKTAIPHEEQKDIIENFITKEPSLASRPLKLSDNQPDLSISSTSYNDDLVSENLAQIFIKQGKKEKAVDIYKKLIWKFPQKKAYFASRIEELQK